MSPQVLAWQKAQPDEANKLVASLNQRNSEVEQSLNHIGTLLASADDKEDPDKSTKLGEMAALTHDKVSLGPSLGGSTLFTNVLLLLVAVGLC